MTFCNAIPRTHNDLQGLPLWTSPNDFSGCGTSVGQLLTRCDAGLDAMIRGCASDAGLTGAHPLPCGKLSNVKRECIRCWWDFTKFEQLADGQCH